MRLSKGVIGSALLSFFMVAIGPLALVAHAADTAQGVQVSPALVELNAVRGKTYTINLRVMNVTGGDLVYNTLAEDFTATGETGTPKINATSNLPETASIKTWVSVEPSFTLGSHQEKNVDVTVTIPSNAEAGGHYGVLRFSGSAPDINTTGVGITASAGVLFLIKVDGTIVEKANLASFFTANNDGKQNSFFENGPINFAVRIQNVGNIHVKPTGNVEIKDMFGNIAGNIPVNDANPPSNVLPNSIRRFDVKLDKSWMFGLYTANLALSYGTNGQAITDTISFWVIPYRIILIGLLIIITIIYILYRLVKVYNRHIIEKAKNENKKHKPINKKG
jgi:hypothetical protein